MQKTKQVLVVEDDASIRELLTELLETESYHVITAQNGADALALFERKIVHPCLILLDLMMPVMDGPTFLKEFFKNFPEHNRMKICILTAVGTSELPRLNNDRIRILRKPLNVEHLMDTVTEMCAI
jgi:DNA-binding response OmpR family regulator